MLNVINKTKYCHACETEKCISYFHKDKNKKDGVQSQCKNCFRLYVISNMVKIHKYQCEYQVKNRGELVKKQRIYQLSPKGKSVHRNKEHKRRTITKIGNIDTNALLSLQQNAKVCYWCNTSLKDKKAHIDHYVPLSKGGEHTLSNLVVACAKCNLKKNAKDPIAFANSIGKLL